MPGDRWPGLPVLLLSLKIELNYNIIMTAEQLINLLTEQAELHNVSLDELQISFRFNNRNDYVEDLNELYIDPASNKPEYKCLTIDLCPAEY